MDQEKPENLKENSDSSHSRTSSPIDDITLDPNFKCRVTDVEPRSISTRQRRISEDTDIDSTSLFNPIYKTQTIVLQPVDTAVVSQDQISKSDPTTPIKLKPSPAKVPKMEEEFKAAFLDMANSFKEIGQTAKQITHNSWEKYPFMGSHQAQTKTKVSFL